MKRKKTLYGLRPHPSRKFENWQNDYDYLEKLSPKELKWLSDFSEEYYKSSSRRRLQSKDQQRERWRAYKANQRDAMNYATSAGLGVFQEVLYRRKPQSFQG